MTAPLPDLERVYEDELHRLNRGRSEAHRAALLAVYRAGQNKWVSVEERLPKADERVLIWFEWGLREKRVEFGRHVNGHWRPEGGNGNFDECVNFWQPLPEPPQSVTEGAE